MTYKAFTTIVLTVIVVLLNLFSYRIIWVSLLDFKEFVYPYTAYGAPELIDREGLTTTIIISLVGLVCGLLSGSISFWVLRPRVISKYVKFISIILVILSLLVILSCGYRFIELLYIFFSVGRCDNYSGGGLGCI
jgi:hypothetical protein